MTTHPQTGVTIALVKDVDDPERLGRVLVEFPNLPGAPAGSSGSSPAAWAHVATPMAGPERGVFFMPEVADEALVAFHHGDFEHPFIVGYLWNGKDKPPTDDRHLRRIKTTAGHVIDFNDNDDAPGIVITTNGGQRIELNDSGPSIRISTAGGQKVELDDSASAITVTTNGSVDVTGTRVNVTARAMLSVSAPITTFDGIVQAKAIVAQAIQSATYAPGVGNLL